jgi:hypothetical protein
LPRRHSREGGNPGHLPARMGYSWGIGCMRQGSGKPMPGPSGEVTWVPAFAGMTLEFGTVRGGMTVARKEVRCSNPCPTASRAFSTS